MSELQESRFGAPQPPASEGAYSLFRRGSAFLAEGRPHHAVIPLERARDLEPSKASVREALARAYYGSGRPSRARDEFAAALELDPANDYAHFGIALCLERAGDLAAARGHARLAVAMRPDHADYRRALERIERHEAAGRGA